jgi:hypothetical protein
MSVQKNIDPMKIYFTVRRRKALYRLKAIGQRPNDEHGRFGMGVPYIFE